MVEVFLCQFVGAVEPVGSVALLAGGTGALGQADAGAFGEEFDRFDKGDAINLLDELEDVAPDAAAEAVVDLAIWIDAK